MSTTITRAEIAANVRELLGRHTTSQEALAAVLGMSQPSLSRRLSGKKAFDTDELFAIAEHFNVPLSRLLQGVVGPSEQGDRSTIRETVTDQEVSPGPRPYDRQLIAA